MTSPRTEKQGRKRLGLLLLLLVFAVAIWFLPNWFAKPGRQDIVVALEAAVNALHAPGRTVETAAAALQTPQAARSFLISQVKEVSYQGAIYTPDQVLHLRTGNRIDRARLLAALIEAQGGRANLMSDGSPSQLQPFTPAALPVEYGALVDILGVDRDAVMADRERALSDLEKRLTENLNLAETGLNNQLEMPAEQVSQPGFTVPRVWVEGTSTDGTAFAIDLEAEEPPGKGTPFEPAQRNVVVAVNGIIASGQRETLLRYEGPVKALMSLSFQPNAGPADVFGGPPGPENIASWAPALAFSREVISGRVFTPSGNIPPDAAKDVPPFAPGAEATAPEVSDLEILDVDASAWPVVTAKLAGTLPPGLNWQAPYLQVTDAGAAVLPRLTGLPDPTTEQRTVVLFLDTSASMARGWRAFLARDLAHAVIDRLPEGQPIQVISHSGDKPRLTYPAGPLTDVEAVKEAVDAAFVLQDGASLSDQLNIALQGLEGAKDVILFGDGVIEDSPQVAQVLGAQNARLFAVAVDADAVAYGTASTAWRWNSATGPKPMADAIVTAMQGGTVIEWTATDDTSQAGDEIVVKIAATGGGATQEKSYIVPENSRTSVSHISEIQLEIEAPGPNGMTRAVRPLLTFGSDPSAWALEMQAQIVMAPAPPPDRVLIATYLDEWLALVDAQESASNNQPLNLRFEGPGFAALLKIDALSGMTRIALGQELATSAPMVVMDRYDVAPDADGTFFLARTLDVLLDGGLRSAEPKPWRTGLALAEAEAEFIGATSVNSLLAGATDTQIISDADIVPDWITDNATDVTVEPGAQFVASAEQNAFWYIKPSGYLQARLISPVAKGARDVEIARQFKQLRNRLDMISWASGAAGSLAGMSGIPHGGIVGILDQNLKLWCFSTVMMGYVGNAIEGAPTPGDGDAKVWEAKASALCELGDPDKLSEAYAKSIASGLISGYIGDVLGEATKGVIGSGPIRDFTNAFFWNAVVSISGVGPKLSAALLDRDG